MNLSYTDHQVEFKASALEFAQAELNEAIYCGFYGLEFEKNFK